MAPGRALALGLALLGGCYSTTPHRAEVVSHVQPRQCEAMVADVFARSGFIRIAGPAAVSMLFSPRMSGPHSSFLGTGVGVGVTIDQTAADTCRVTLEALSPDVNCAEEHAPLSCGGLGEVRTAAVPGSGPGPTMPNRLGDGPSARCPMLPSMTCPFSYAPGEHNDRAVDELARRIREQLGVRISIR